MTDIPGNIHLSTSSYTHSSSYENFLCGQWQMLPCNIPHSTHYFPPQAQGGMPKLSKDSRLMLAAA